MNDAMVPMASRQSCSSSADQSSPESSLSAADQGFLHGEVLVWLGAPVHVLHAEIAQRLGEHLHVVQVAHDQGQRGIEVCAQPRQVVRKQAAHARVGGKEALVESGRQVNGPRRQRGVAALNACNGFPVHRQTILQ